MPSAPANVVLSFEDTRRCVEEHAKTLELSEKETELVPLLDALGRVLAQDVRADRDFPPFPRATRDGFAVRAADLSTPPVKLKVIGQVKAGAALAPVLGPISPGTCAEIMTGAPVPDGADTVVMVEFTRPSSDGAQVEIQRAVTAGENIVPAGSEARVGQLLLARGTRIGYPQVAVAASVGNAKVSVYNKPRIAILSTGDEIVDITATPGASQIRNSNSFSVAAQVLAAGAEPVQLPIAPDERGPLRELISQGLDSGLLLLSGGVSMGKYDLVEDVLREFDAEFFFTGAMIQPGKPIIFGRVPNEGAPPLAKSKGGAHTIASYTYFFGLPGNPISTMVTFELFARPIIDGLSGAAPQPLLFTQANLKSELKTKPGLSRFLPAVVTGDHANPEVELVGWQGSGDIVSMARANCYLVVPPDRERIAAGESVSVLLR